VDGKVRWRRVELPDGCGQSKDAAAAYMMGKEAARRDQFDPAED
jgi:hypothetical protein